MPLGGCSEKLRRSALSLTGKISAKIPQRQRRPFLPPSFIIFRVFGRRRSFRQQSEIRTDPVPRYVGGFFFSSTTPWGEVRLDASKQKQPIRRTSRPHTRPMVYGWLRGGADRFPGRNGLLQRGKQCPTWMRRPPWSSGSLSSYLPPLPGMVGIAAAAEASPATKSRFADDRDRRRSLSDLHPHRPRFGRQGGALEKALTARCQCHFPRWAQFAAGVRVIRQGYWCIEALNAMMTEMFPADVGDKALKRTYTDNISEGGSTGSRKAVRFSRSNPCTCSHPSRPYLPMWGESLTGDSRPRCRRSLSTF